MGNSIKNKLEQLLKDSQETIKGIQTIPDLDQIKSTLLGKTGELSDILKGLKDLTNDEKPVIGKLANDIKSTLARQIQDQKSYIETEAINQQLYAESIDTSLPGKRPVHGHKHPIRQTIDELTRIFKRLGFSVETGPEIENDFYNFEALNIPDNHPARDMHDTFYLESGHVMRTHTSPVQIHVMERETPPIKIIVPGKVYRCDADVTHSPVFHQIEGLYVDKKVTFADLKGTLEFFLKEVFGAKQRVRFRPSYFPFTEPSTEVDVECFKCSGAGCSLCKQTGWLEILGAGMVNREVFRAVKYDPDTVRGFAFGLGIERIAMLKYGISDIRLFYENDQRFLNQF